MQAAGGGGGPGCGCKGIRSCLLCEGPAPAAPPPQGEDNFTYCPATGLAKGNEHSEFAGWAFPFPGVFLVEEFISEEEECEIVELMDRDDWKPSQSGRKKQDYGPKVNFKKQRLKAGSFTGLPGFSRKIVAQMKACAVLSGFLPVEQCNLDYRPERGSAIDPHFDDWWLWGERLVSLNLLSKTVLSMSCDSEDTIQLFPISSKEELSPPGSFTQTSSCRNSGEGGTKCFLSPRLVPAKEAHRAPPRLRHLQGALRGVQRRGEARGTGQRTAADCSFLSRETRVTKRVAFCWEMCKMRYGICMTRFISEVGVRNQVCAEISSIKWKFNKQK
ncbi:alpha-ketoglutarate-dependent dioxygenase alkB homolog 4 isoform 1-T1 [Cyanocitta cristata]